MLLIKFSQFIFTFSHIRANALAPLNMSTPATGLFFKLDPVDHIIRSTDLHMS